MMAAVVRPINAQKEKAIVTPIQTVVLDWSVEQKIVTIPWGLNLVMIAATGHNALVNLEQHYRQNVHFFVWDRRYVPSEMETNVFILYETMLFYVTILCGLFY